MFAAFLDFYVRVFTTLLPALALTFVAVSAQRADLSAKQTAQVLGTLGLVYGLWSAAASMLGERGVLMPPETVTGVPYILIFLFGGTAVLAGLGRLTRPGRAVTDRADQRALMVFQVPRVMGGVFLAGWAFGVIPWQFALPAGLGDIWAGVAGWQAYRALRHGAENARTLVWRANIIGMADFAVAVVTGLMTSEGFLHVMAVERPNIINQYPLVLFPALFVPIFLTAHILSVVRLRQDTGSATLASPT
ncbi:MAG: hypothetical protein Tsb0019_23950 [Roseibium sp.]